MVFSSLEDKITKYFKQKKYNDKKDFDKIDEFLIGNSNYKANKRLSDRIISKMNGAYNKFNNITEPPKIEYINGNEKQRRTIVNKLALEEVSKAYKAYYKKTAFIPNLVNFNKIQVERQLQHLLCPDIENMTEEEMKTFNNDLLTMSSDRILDILSKNIDKISKFADDIMSAETDEEFVSKCKNNAHLFFGMGELQYNEVIVDKFKKTFNIVEFPKNIQNKWEIALNKCIDASALANRLSTIADTNYLIFKDFQMIRKMETWELENEDLLNDCGDKYYESTMSDFEEQQDYLNFYKNNGLYINTLLSFGSAGRFNDGSININLIRTELNMINEKTNIENPIYMDSNNNIITEDEAINNIYNKKYVQLYDGKQFKQTIKSESMFFNLSKPKDYILFTIKDSNLDKLNRTLDSIKEELEKGNPWYMKARNVINPNDYQKVINEIDKLKKLSFYDEKKVEEGFKKISDYAKEYIDRKTEEGKLKEGLTEKRIDAMTYCFDKIKVSLSQNEIQKALDKNHGKKEPCGLGDDLFLEGLDDQVDLKKVDNVKEINKDLEI